MSYSAYRDVVRQTKYRARDYRDDLLSDLRHIAKEHSGLYSLFISTLAAVVQLIFGVVLFLFTIVTGLQGWTLLFLFGGALLLIGVRDIVIAFCIWASQHVLILYDAINVIIRVMNILFPVLTFAINVLITGFDDIVSEIESLLHLHKAVIPAIPAYTQVSIISRQALANTFTQVPLTCARYDSADDVVSYFIKLGLHDYTCPIVRYWSPTAWMYHLLESTLSWTYSGSAMPYVNDPGANCAARSNFGVYDTFCASLGFGYVVLYLGVFALCFMVFLFTYGSIFRLIWYSIRLASIIIYFLVGSVIISLDAVLA